MIRNAFSSFARCTRMHTAHAHKTQADNTTKIHTTDSELHSILSILPETRKCFVGLSSQNSFNSPFSCVCVCVCLFGYETMLKTRRQKPCRRSFPTIILHAIEHHPKKAETTNQSNMLKDVGACVRLRIACFPQLRSQMSFIR